MAGLRQLAVLALLVAALLLVGPPAAAGAPGRGHWLFSTPPDGSRPLATVAAGSAIQCGLRCIAEPRCAAIVFSAQQAVDCRLMTCPPEWEAFDGGCYHVFDNEIRWDAADAVCVASVAGGHLVSIGSSAENSFVSSLVRPFGGFFHIGMYWPKGSAVGDSRWTDGSPVTFFAWDDNQPNDNRNAGVIGTNIYPPHEAWNDMRSSVKHGFVCEYRPRTY